MRLPGGRLGRRAGEGWRELKRLPAALDGAYRRADIEVTGICCAPVDNSYQRICPLGVHARYNGYPAGGT